MTSYSPHELIFGRAPHFLIDLALNLKQNAIVCEGNISEYVQRLAQHQQTLFQKAIQVQDKYDARRKEYFDRNRSEADFSLGDHVTWYQISHLTGHQRKMTPNWKGSGKLWKCMERTQPESESW